MESNDLKPFDFSGISSTPEQHEAGTWVRIMRTDRPGEPSGFEVLLAGSESRRMRDVGRGWADEDKARGDRELTTEEAAVLLRQRDLDLVVGATIDWRYPPGFTGPACSPEATRTLYSDYVDIRRQVSQKLGQNVRFLKA